MLPFEPTAERPGYCLSCYSERNDSSAKGAGSAARKPSKTARLQHTVESRPRDEKAERPVRQDSAIERAGDTPHPEVFAGLDIQARTRSALSRMGITVPTPIQEQAIPWLIEGRDVVGQAMTGSGKTLAFGIPLVEGSDRSAPGVQGLVLVPTRELAIQVASVIDEVSAGRVSTQLLYGGRGIGGEKKDLQRGSQIVVGTPGRTLDHLRQGNLVLGSVRMLVLDEADEMLDRGFARDVESIIAATPAKRQTALFSATLPDWVEKTAKKHLRDPKTLQVVAEEGDGLKIEHLIYRIDKPGKIAALQTLLNERDGAPIMVFGKTKHGVKKLAKQLLEAGYPVGPLQGNMSQNAREKVMADFRAGRTPVLVATNVAARGLDIEGIAQVINFDLPDSIQLFTHRVGRTGRMGKSGEAVTFITPEDDKKWREIERGFDENFRVKRWGDRALSTATAPIPRPKDTGERQPPKRQVLKAEKPAIEKPQAAAPQSARARAGSTSTEPSKGNVQSQRGVDKPGDGSDGQSSGTTRSVRPNRRRDTPDRGSSESPQQRRDTPDRGNERAPQRRDAPEPGNERHVVDPNTKQYDEVRPDTPQAEAERAELARTRHTPPPGSMPAKRSPWLRFGRRP